MIKFILPFLLVFLSITTHWAQYSNVHESPDAIIGKMFATINEIKTLTYTLKNSERINGKLLSGEQNIKFSSEPKRCYFYMVYPNEGSEFFYNHGENDNQVIFDPNGFPYMNINLDPMGVVMRNYNHHTIYETGFKYMGDLLEDMYERHSEYFTLKGDVIWNGRECYQVEMINPEFRYIYYYAHQGESPRQIAEKLKVSEYMLYELNPSLSKYKHLKKDLKIKVPTAYAAKVVLLIDKEYYLPISQKIYDEKGLFELYEYRNLKLNPTISENEFKADTVKKKPKVTAKQ